MKFDPINISPIVVWELTLKCNLNCLHCGSSAGKIRKNELSTKEALDLCDDIAKINADEVCLIGGEVFLRDDWFDICKKIRDLGMKLDIISNAYHNNKDEIISKLGKLDPFTIAISIDGAKAATHDHIRGAIGSYDKAVSFLMSVKEANLPPTVVTTVNKINYKELPEIRDFILGKRIAWQIQTATPHGRFPKELALSDEEFYAVGLFIAGTQKKYPKKEMPLVGAHDLGYHSQYIPCLGLYPEWRGCPGGILGVGIQSDGGIKGCLAMPDFLIEGNIRQKSLVDIWNSPSYFSYNRCFKDGDLGEHCVGCKYGHTCKGGCTAVSASITGKVHNDPRCFYRIENELVKKEKDPLSLKNLIQ